MTNMRNVASLLDDNVTTIGALFDGRGQVYTFKILRTLAEELKRNDRVLVDTVNGIQMVTVAEVHDEPEIDPDSGTLFKWAFAKVDLTVLDDLRKQEDVIIKKLQKHQRNCLKESVLKSLGIDDIKQVGLD